MKRRAFVLGLSVVAAGWPLRTRGQDSKHAVGIWWSPVQVREQLARYKRRLAELGWAEGRNIRFLVQAWDGDTAKMRQQADELLAARPELIVVVSNPAVAILQPLSGQVPIVFAMVADPVGSGFIANLARPGGPITGFTNFEPSMGGKWLEVLREAAPATSRVLVMMHPETSAHNQFSQAIQQLAGSLQVEAKLAGVHNPAEIERAFSDFGSGGNGGVIALPHAITEVNRDLIIKRATENQLPSIFAFEEHAQAGALVTYGIDRADTILRTADYVDRILRGAKPADLPVQAPQVFELAINLRTAKTLGLTIAPALLARADKIIE